MDKKIFSFENLEVYKYARAFVKTVYQLQRCFPREEQYALCDQIRRASISITSNIAEGCGRNSMKEKVHFLEIACGSLYEVFSQLQIAQDLNYISDKDVEAMRPQVEQIAKMLSGLRKSYENPSPINYKP